MSAIPPTQYLANILRLVIAALDGASMWGPFPRPLAQLIMARIGAILRHLQRLIARIEAGTYRPRGPSATPRRAPAPGPRRPGPLPTGPAWLHKLLPGMAPHTGHLHALLQDPAMQALISQAPGAMRRPLRSLCRMLGVTPPPILAIPKSPPRPKAAKAAPPTKRPDPPPAPSWVPKRTRWTLTRIRGSPKPA